MNTMTVLLIFLVVLIVLTGISLWLYMRWIYPKVSPLRETLQKETSSPQISSNARAFNPAEARQQSINNFDSPSWRSQMPQMPPMPLDQMRTMNTDRPGLSSSPYNFRTVDEKPQIITSRNRSVEHYEQRIHAYYEPVIDGIHLVFTDTVITNAIEVDNVFTVCERRLRDVMRARGWERAGWIGDLGGYTLVGTEATTLMGETLKLFLDKLAPKTKSGLYLVVHYSSKAAPPDQETLNEKLLRIQFTTAGVINEFQGNVLGTREEAIAFYLRLRQELLAGR